MYSIIILAAGSGSRAGLGFNKVLFEINGKEVIQYSIDFFNKDDKCDEIILVVSNNDFNYMNKKYKDTTSKIILGGLTRQESVYNALKHVNSNYVFIHDGARPYLSLDTIKQLKESIISHISVTLGIKVKDTIKEVNENYVVKTLDRSNIYKIQTPQAFHTSKIIKAHELAIKDKFIVTDDTLLIEKYFKEKTLVVEGNSKNIKLTTKDDLRFLEVIL